LIQCLAVHNADDYVPEVAKQLVGMELNQGYRILRVIGAGNIGTTVLAIDKQEKANVVLKIYHLKSATTQGLREYNMLYLAQNCPSIVKVFNFLHS
jgi:serine/threonine protein kinase